MTTDTDVIQGITDTLQRVYGDATQTSLDRVAASEVWASLQSQGVVPWAVVAAIVQAVGGQVTIPWTILVDPPTEMMVVDDPLNDAKTIKVRY